MKKIFMNPVKFPPYLCRWIASMRWDHAERTDYLARPNEPDSDDALLVMSALNRESGKTISLIVEHPYLLCGQNDALQIPDYITRQDLHIVARQIAQAIIRRAVDHTYKYPAFFHYWPAAVQAGVDLGEEFTEYMWNKLRQALSDSVSTFSFDTMLMNIGWWWHLYTKDHFEEMRKFVKDQEHSMPERVSRPKPFDPAMNLLGYLIEGDLDLYDQRLAGYSEEQILYYSLGFRICDVAPQKQMIDDIQNRNRGLPMYLIPRINKCKIRQRDEYLDILSRNLLILNAKRFPKDSNESTNLVTSAQELDFAKRISDTRWIYSLLKGNLSESAAEILTKQCLLVGDIDTIEQIQNHGFNNSSLQRYFRYLEIIKGAIPDKEEFGSYNRIVKDLRPLAPGFTRAALKEGRLGYAWLFANLSTFTEDDAELYDKLIGWLEIFKATAG